MQRTLLIGVLRRAAILDAANAALRDDLTKRNVAMHRLTTELERKSHDKAKHENHLNMLKAQQVDQYHQIQELRESMPQPRQLLTARRRRWFQTLHQQQLQQQQEQQ
eukprot:NODE_15482_length_1048_cov_2.060803.p1 GENE.NODE_15482_length_1048_cov_2.060803~~NODE_15482_length_1048_cov_2.060803.p1  ORF type:complete len:107 (+),score=22.61 NODE_15482_length_1048_cov_2.060803:414-734(+)